MVLRSDSALAFGRDCLRRWVFLAIVVCSLLIWIGDAVARAANTVSRGSTSEVCDLAALLAARTHGVPHDVLRAVTRTETGRNRDGGLQPWPWTVNMEGTGRWFETRAEAYQYVQARYASGARSFDLGCFQINHRWHSQHFVSIDEMFDPVANADYAARFLSALFDETGDWSRAAAAYHSRTPRFANRYRARFDRIRAELDSFEDGISDGIAGPAPLIAQGETRLGSLVPLAGARATAGQLAFFER